jgi:hypothetical protein
VTRPPSGKQRPPERLVPLPGRRKAPEVTAADRLNDLFRFGDDDRQRALVRGQGIGLERNQLGWFAMKRSGGIFLKLGEGG